MARDAPAPVADEEEAKEEAPRRMQLPIDLMRDQTFEKTAIETSWREVSPKKKAPSPTTKDPLIARLRGKKSNSKKTRRSVDP